MTRPDHDRTVLDPRWEDELRAGLEADGGQGSVERELEVVHVLRHAREPEPIDDTRLDALWGEIEAQAFPSAKGTSWWRRRWWVALVPAATAAAVLLFVLRGPDDPVGEADVVARGAASPTAGSSARAPAPAPADGSVRSLGAAAPRAEEESAIAQAGPVAGRSAFEEQFAALAPRARAEVLGSVEDGRGKLRAELIADARMASVGDAGGDVSTGRARGSAADAGTAAQPTPATGPSPRANVKADDAADSPAGGER